MLWLLLIPAFILLYLFLIAPSSTHPDDSALRGWLYAHRGLHDGNHAVPENSMEAFRRAVEAGYGIELDVQLTRDGMLVVHHDGSLKRVCGVDRAIRDLTYDELCRIPLPDGSRIPLFSEVLNLVDGRTPLIVEIKHYGGAERIAAEALKFLRAYKGAFCVESFDPRAVAYFRRSAPDFIRGQLASGGKWDKGSMNFPTHLLLKYLLVNAWGRPHFVAYQCQTDGNLSMWLTKRFFRPLLAGWTLRSQQALDDARRSGYDYPIFELFTPDTQAK